MRPFGWRVARRVLPCAGTTAVIRMRSPVKRAAALCVNALLRLLPAAGQPTTLSAPRVLVVRCDHIGDAIMATAVLEPLRRALGPARLDVLAGPWGEAIFRAHPAVDEVIVYATPWWLQARGARTGARLRAWLRLPAVVRQLRRARYDCVVDLRGDLRHIVFFLAASGARERVSSDRTGGTRLLTRWNRYVPARHEVDQDAAVAALLGAEGPFTPHLAPAAVAAATGETVPELSRDGYVVFALAGTEENRAWPAEHAAQVADHLWREHRLRAVIVGTAVDVPRADTVAREASSPVTSLCGRTTLPQLLGVLASARAALVVDSGPMHAAAALGVPTLALFGPGDPGECAPRARNAVVLATTAPCGCEHPRCDYTPGPGRCMRELAPERVIAALGPLLARSA